MRGNLGDSNFLGRQVQGEMTLIPPEGTTGAGEMTLIPPEGTTGAGEMTLIPPEGTTGAGGDDTDTT